MYHFKNSHKFRSENKTNITPLKDYVHVHYNDYKIKIKNNLTYGYL